MGRLFAVLVFWAAAAGAQTDPMEAQRCVWACLANSSGANDPAYHACVEARCTQVFQQTQPQPQPAAPSPQRQLTTGAWIYGPLDPSDWPYLDGGFARVTAADRQITLAFWCGKEGTNGSLSLSGPAVDAAFGPDTNEAMQPVLLAVGDARTVRVRLGWFDGALQGDVLRTGAPIEDLSAGSAVSIYTNAGGLVGTLPLLGSRQALGFALEQCG